jgi:hypothetical protein
LSAAKYSPDLCTLLRAKLLGLNNLDQVNKALSGCCIKFAPSSSSKDFEIGSPIETLV